MAVRSAANGLPVLTEAVVAEVRDKEVIIWDAAVDGVLGEAADAVGWAAPRPLDRAGIVSVPTAGTSSHMWLGSLARN